MTEAKRQAFFRFVTVAVAGAVSAMLLNLGLVVDLISDPGYRVIAMIALTGILQALLKLIGGATEPATPGLLAGANGSKRVRWWSA